MTYCDNHVHTLFSDDGCVSAKAMIKAAAEKGLGHIAVTDHSDPLHPEGYFGVTEEKITAYTETIASLKEYFKNEISVSVGLEIGYTDESAEICARLAENDALEYVINSVHCVDGKDCYEKNFFDGKTRDYALKTYLDAVVRSVRVPYRYDALGHLGYISRVAPYENRAIKYGEFSAQIDAIFSELIKRGAILEVNTSVARAPCKMLPDEDLLKIYYDMGGRKVTTSSDAHTTERLGFGFENVRKTLKSIGFTRLYARKGGEELEFAI